MKKRIALLLFALLLLAALLAGCGRQTQPSFVQPFDFYYRAQEPDYRSGYGVVGVETRELGVSPLSDEELITLYLQGPVSESLVSPFPPGVQLLGVRMSATTLTVRLSSEYAALQGVDASLADACIVKTLLGLANVRRVRIVAMGDDGTELRSAVLDGGDILLADSQTASDKLDLTLYFADAEGRYLLSEKRTVNRSPASELPQRVTELLLEGPQTAGLYPTLPMGTMLLDVNVENGVCAVDLSSEFVKNFHLLNLPPHLTLLSLANSLTELDGIDFVHIYIEGRQDQLLGPFPLSGDFSAETRAVGPSHPELNELDCTLCLPVGSAAELYPLSLRVRSGSNELPAQTLLRALWSFAPQNGLANPWYDAPAPLSVTTANGLCTVTLPSGGIPGQTDAERSYALHILVSTLQTLDGVDQVEVAEQ